MINLNKGHIKTQQSEITYNIADCPNFDSSTCLSTILIIRIRLTYYQAQNYALSELKPQIHLMPDFVNTKLASLLTNNATINHIFYK